jgi:hypothetical protein
METRGLTTLTAATSSARASQAKAWRARVRVTSRSTPKGAISSDGTLRTSRPRTQATAPRKGRCQLEATAATSSHRQITRKLTITSTRSTKVASARVRALVALIPIILGIVAPMEELTPASSTLTESARRTLSGTSSTRLRGATTRQRARSFKSVPRQKSHPSTSRSFSNFESGSHLRRTGQIRSAPLALVTLFSIHKPQIRRMARTCTRDTASARHRQESHQESDQGQTEPKQQTSCSRTAFETGSKRLAQPTPRTKRSTTSNKIRLPERAPPIRPREPLTSMPILVNRVLSCLATATAKSTTSSGSLSRRPRAMSSTNCKTREEARQPITKRQVEPTLGETP